MMKDELCNYYECAIDQQEHDIKRIAESLCGIIEYLRSNTQPQSQYQTDLLLKLERAHLPILMEILER